MIFHVNRRELPKVPIELMYERLISKNDSLAKEVAEKIKKVNELMNDKKMPVKPELLTKEELLYKIKY